MLIAIKKIAPALATGNSIVLKPSEMAPVSVLEVRLLYIQGVVYTCYPLHLITTISHSMW